MFDNDILQKYLQAIDIERVKAIRELLPLYRMGFKTNKDVLSELQVHSGYSKTIYRYIVNKDILTYQELMCILSLYDITDVEDVALVEFSDHIVISVPSPDVLFAISEIMLRILKVPDVMVEIGTPGRARLLVTVPEPNVIINVQQIILNLQITLVPVPQVFLLGASNRFDITFVPEPGITVGVGLADRFTINLVPEPTVGLGGVGGFIINFVPQPFVELETQAIPDDKIFYGVVLTQTRPQSVEFSNLISLLVSPIPSSLNVLFPAEIGFYVLAIPASALLRRRWIVNEFNQGLIGGAIDPIRGNLWPDPVLQMHGGRNYQVYISNYATHFTQNVSFLDSMPSGGTGGSGGGEQIKI